MFKTRTIYFKFKFKTYYECNKKNRGVPVYFISATRTSLHNTFKTSVTTIYFTNERIK